MRLVSDSEANPRIKLYLVSIDNSTSSPGNSSSLAIVVALDSDQLPHLGYLLTAYVQNCGTTKSKECARDILALVDKEIEQVRRNGPSQYDLLR